MRQTHDKELCCSYGLWHQLDTELLNANLVHYVGNPKGSAVESTPGAYRKFAPIPYLAGAKCLFRLPYYGQVKWSLSRYTLGDYVFTNRLPRLRESPNGRRELLDFL